LSRREQIQMTRGEIDRFLGAARTMILCSSGRDGAPHPMPMWFGVEPDGTVVMTTFTKSQKIRNLERDPRVALLVEAGEKYDELQGVVLYGEAELVRELPAVLDILARVTGRTGGAPNVDDAVLRAGLEATARKRTGIRVRPTRVVSWDHRKLGGVY
jgi:PPOX class probable F420-dependent enzyme